MTVHIPIRVRHKLTSLILRPNFAYRLALKYRHGTGMPKGLPVAPWENSVMASKRDWESATEQVARLGLPRHSDSQKHWDSLAALDCILKNIPRNGAVMDAGAEYYSSILPWLFLYGYKNLVGINLAFRHFVRRGPIRYEPGDITKTHFGDRSFDAVTCLSVIEHGVPIREYFREMSRILKPGGILISSTDYWDTPIDTHGAIGYGQPVHVFSREELESILASAAEFGLGPTGPIDLVCSEKAVRWPGYDHEYTFMMFTLRKRAGTSAQK
jgi:SAM-dependent methyltransferase